MCGIWKEGKKQGSLLPWDRKLQTWQIEMAGTGEGSACKPGRPEEGGVFEELLHMVG